ncbi:MAG TPA: hypothetical protein VJ805_04700 [Nitrospiraceae bacterium]|nr:hypothetical protein [Nitrospiraceae bacterium]
MPAFSEAVLPMWTALLVGWLTNICYITGEIRWAETKTTANLKATCPIIVSVQEAVVTLTSRKWIVQIPVPQESGTQSFMYRWGRSSAQVGDHSVPVSYGPRGGA